MFGGPHAIISPDELIQHPCADSVCICEGEQVLTELSNTIDSGKSFHEIEGLWTKQNGAIIKNPPRKLIEDLGKLPLDDKELYYNRYPLLKNAPFKVFTVSRGCPYRCSYCCNSYLRALLKGKHLRFRPVDQVIHEIIKIRNNFPLEYVMFRSDTFTADKTWCINLLNEYKKNINMPFYAQIVARELSEELIQHLAHAGMTNIIFAIESGSERIREDILHRPHISNARIVELSRIIREHGIKITSQEMFAIPTETLDEAFMTVDLNVKIRARMTPTILHPYLHTEIMKYYNAETISNTAGNHLTGSTPLYGKETKRIVILQRISGWISRLPWKLYSLLKPIFRLITYIPDNPGFKFISNLNFFYVQRRLSNYAGSFLFYIRFACHAAKNINSRHFRYK
ncbi:MAG: radical SAM protein [bacterium]